VLKNIKQVKMQGSSNQAATVGGFVAIGLWATTIAIVGSLASALGVWSSSSTTQAMAGVLGLILGGHKARGWYRLPGRYLAVCGGLFVLYMVLLSAAIGAARGAGDLIAVSVLNYLWPALTVAFSVPLFGHKATRWLAPSLLLGSAGAWLAIVGDQPEAVLASPNCALTRSLVPPTPLSRKGAREGSDQLGRVSTRLLWGFRQQSHRTHTHITRKHQHTHTTHQHTNNNTPTPITPLSCASAREGGRGDKRPCVDCCVGCR
jgi:hypothetical protein